LGDWVTLTELHAQPREAREVFCDLDLSRVGLGFRKIVVAVFRATADRRRAINRRIAGTRATGTSIIVIADAASSSATASSSVCSS
jgi:hypothetical protein